MIKGICQFLEVSPATIPASIVTGVETEATNVLLQQLAIAAYCFKGRKENPAPTPAAATPPPLVPKVIVQPDILRHFPSWMTSFRLEVSQDGEAFAPYNTTDVFDTTLESADDCCSIVLPDGDIMVKYIRLYPIAWSGPKATVRISIISHGNGVLNNVGDINAENAGQSMLSCDHVLNMMHCLHSGTAVVIEAIQFLYKYDELKKFRKNEEMRKVRLPLCVVCFSVCLLFTYHVFSTWKAWLMRRKLWKNC